MCWAATRVWSVPLVPRRPDGPSAASGLFLPWRTGAGPDLFRLPGACVGFLWCRAEDLPAPEPASFKKKLRCGDDAATQLYVPRGASTTRVQAEVSAKDYPGTQRQLRAHLAPAGDWVLSPAMWMGLGRCLQGGFGAPVVLLGAVGPRPPLCAHSHAPDRVRGSQRARAGRLVASEAGCVGWVVVGRRALVD